MCFGHERNPVLIKHSADAGCVAIVHLVNPQRQLDHEALLVREGRK